MTTYLDHAATTPLRPEVAAAMAEVHATPLGNPTGSHPPAQRARRLLEEARDEVASFLGRDPGDIVFTSGGTEAANLAVLGTVEAARCGRGEAVLLCSAVEHPTVRESARAAAHAGADSRVLPVDESGVLDLDALARTLTSRCTLVAVMTANNETGVVQPLGDVIDAVRRRASQAFVFTDAVQAAPYLDLAEVAAAADLVSLSAHKMGGPVGTGALAVGPRVALTARQHGGGQDASGGAAPRTWPVRSGSPLRCDSSRPSEPRGRRGWRRCVTGCARGCLRRCPTRAPRCRDDVAVLPGHLHLCLPGVEREELLVALGQEGVCVSGGSSCASGALEPSHVLAAMGVAPELAAGAVRFSLGYSTTEADVDRALAAVPGVVDALRRRA